MNLKRKSMLLVLVFCLLIGVTACSNNSEGEDVSQEETTANIDENEAKEESEEGKEEENNVELVSEGMMDIENAKQFTIEKFEGGYRIIRTKYIDEPTLIVPEGKPIPEDLEEGTQIIQLPITKSYVAASNIAAMLDGIGAIDKLTLIGQDVSWKFPSIQEQLDSGETIFAGRGDKIDYELIGINEPQFVILNGYDEDEYEKFKMLGIPMIFEENTFEPNLLGRMEWMRCLGVLYGVEDQAEAYYNDQISRIKAIQDEGETGKVVGFGAKSAQGGKYGTRKAGDFRADYIRYAGGTYNLNDLEPDKGGNIYITDEDFYTNFKDCDVLIWSYEIPNDGTMEDLIKHYPPIVDFKAYENDMIYTQARIFIQLGAREPASVVEDIHKIITSDEPITTDFIIHLPKNPQ